MRLKKVIGTKRINHRNLLVRSVGVEPTAHGLEVRCSIQLSYERNAYHAIT